MLRVAIVDDVQEDALTLEGYLRKFENETGNKYAVTHYRSGAEFLQAQGCAFDLIVMDIDMPGINGVDAARRLRAEGCGTVLMFVTNMAQYALEGYEVEAVDYILKPVSYQDFTLKLRKAERYIVRNQDVQVVVRTTTGIVPMPVSSIFYVESTLHYLVYHTAEGSYRARGSLSDAEGALPAAQFARCNISYLVNLQHVKAVEKDEVLVGPNCCRVKISRGKRLDFLERLTRYLGGIGQ